jgi:beta-alanine degradation protein BauB
MTPSAPPVQVLDRGTYDLSAFDDELQAAPDNGAIGTACLFANDEVRVWEVRLDPGQRGPFHIHAGHYFWTCVDAGTARQRYVDGTYADLSYSVGTTMFFAHSPADAMIHDLENIGDDVLRFITVELLDRV